MHSLCHIDEANKLWNPKPYCNGLLRAQTMGLIDKSWDFNLETWDPT